jgi:hypothetical protein
MIPIYVGFAVLIVLVFIGFGISNFLQNRAHDQALAFDNSTPSPAPSPASTSKPIQLHDLQPIGTLMDLPKPDLQKGVLADSSNGGRGQPVDGIPCQAEMVQVHVHSHLAIFVNGKQAQVPGFIGITPTPTGGCLYWLHTHGPDGIIHVEAVTAQSPNGGPYTLGDFFDIWGQPLSSTQVGPYKGAVTAFVNNAPYSGDLRSIPLRAHQQVVLEVGSPVVPPPTYRFPPND